MTLEVFDLFEHRKCTFHCLNVETTCAGRVGTRVAIYGKALLDALFLTLENLAVHKQ